MKAKLTYWGEQKMQTTELELEQIPRVGDGMAIKIETDNCYEFASCDVVSIDWHITNGVLDYVIIYLIDEK